MVVVVLLLLQAALPLLQVVVVLPVVEGFLLQLLALPLALVVQPLLFPLVEVQPVLPPHLHSKSLLSQTERPSQMIIQLRLLFSNSLAYKVLLYYSYRYNPFII